MKLNGLFKIFFSAFNICTSSMQCKISQYQLCWKAVTTFPCQQKLLAITQLESWSQCFITAALEESKRKPLMSSLKEKTVFLCYLQVQGRQYALPPSSHFWWSYCCCLSTVIIDARSSQPPASKRL